MSGRPPRRSPPRRLSTSPETDMSPGSHRDRRHSSKEDVLSALGGRKGSLTSPRSSIDAAAAVPLPLPAPTTAPVRPSRPAPKPMRRPPQRSEPEPEAEPEPEPEAALDETVEPWLREAQLLEAAIGACATSPARFVACARERWWPLTFAAASHSCAAGGKQERSARGRHDTGTATE
jgi:hypothetical protein